MKHSERRNRKKGEKENIDSLSMIRRERRGALLTQRAYTHTHTQKYLHYKHPLCIYTEAERETYKRKGEMKLNALDKKNKKGKNIHARTHSHTRIHIIIDGAT